MKRIPLPTGEGGSRSEPGEGYRTKLFCVGSPSPAASRHPLPLGEGFVGNFSPYPFKTFA
jgi:hypothetical protein